MNLKNIRKSIQWVIKKIKQIKIGFHFELKIQKIKNQTLSPTFRISGSKSNIYVSLAFKSDTQRRSPSEWDEEYPYLKGEGYDSKGKTVNFEEKITGAGHGAGEGEHRWKLTVFQSGTTRLGEIGGGDGQHSPEDNINCDKQDVFKVTKPSDSMGGDWENAVTKVTFKLEDCGRSGSRRECDIEIADSSRFKNKNSSSSRDKLGKTTKDLYLKGQGYDSSGKPVNFDEKIIGDGHARGKGEHRWQLKRFKSGTTQLGELSGGDGNAYGDDAINCNRKDVFEITKPNMGGAGDWEKAVADIPYYLVGPETAIKQEIFEMKGI